MGCVKDKDGMIAVDGERIKEIWRSHFERLSNEEFPWDSSSLGSAAAVSGPIEEIKHHKVKAAIRNMKTGLPTGRPVW